MREFWFDPILLAFDGTVLEAFGGPETLRIHLVHLRAFTITRRSFLVHATGRSETLCGLTSEGDHERAHALVDAVNEARSQRGWAPVPID